MRYAIMAFVGFVGASAGYAVSLMVITTKGSDGWVWLPYFGAVAVGFTLGAVVYRGTESWDR